MKLYEITERYANLMTLLDDDAIPADVVTQALAGVEDELADKGQQIARLVRNVDAEAKAIRAEENRLADRRRALENKRDRIKDYLQGQMEACNLKKLNGLLNISLQANPPSVDIADEGKVPAEYKVQPLPVVDRRAILDALKAGAEVPGCTIKQGRSLRIW